MCILALHAVLRQTLDGVACFQLQPDSAAYKVEISRLEGTTSQYADAGFNIVTRAHCENSAQSAMDDSLDSGYAISVKTEDQKPDSLNEETLQIVGPQRWAVDDHGVLVNADESEAAIKVEKPDWTTEIADCSTVIPGQGDGDTKDAVLIVKEEEDAMFSEA